MRRDTMGIILTSNDRIPPITDIRANSALPIAGRYRIIDFVLSCMANSGITNIGVATEANYSSLMDHIKSGKPWDLDRKNWGLNILPPNLEKVSYGSIKGNIDILAGISDFIHRSQQTYVILSLGNSIYNIDFEEVVKNHIESQADVTILYKEKFQDLQRLNLTRKIVLQILRFSRIIQSRVWQVWTFTLWKRLCLKVSLTNAVQGATEIS